MPATVTPTHTPIPLTPSPTPDLRYVGLTIDDLTNRTYGGGLVEIVETMEEKELFTRYLIKYPSDGLTLYGFMNVPHEGDNFPVALVLHGYMPEAEYKVKTYTTRYADALAEAGYFVFHPNYRNHPPSDSGNYNAFRVDYAIDVLNLIAIIQEQSQDPAGTLRRADADYIHIMGHSMGGGIAQRVITVRPDAVRAVVLYGSMSGDEQRNFEKIVVWSEGRHGAFELGTDAETIAKISPINYLNRWQTAVSIHHGEKDGTVPLAWSTELCERLQAQIIVVECFTYPNAPHTFVGGTDALFTERMIHFFKQY